MTTFATLSLGLVIGILFGVSLERSRAFEPGVVIGQMQFRNFILVKLWFSAIATALVTVTLLHEMGFVTLHPKPVHGVADILGGVLIGVGMTLAGGCPVMILAQIGAGYRDAWCVVLGGLAGALTFAAFASLLHPLLIGGPGSLTLAGLLATPFRALAVAVGVALFACIMAMERLRPWRLDLGPQADGVLHDRPSVPDPLHASDGREPS